MGERATMGGELRQQPEGLGFSGDRRVSRADPPRMPDIEQAAAMAAPATI